MRILILGGGGAMARAIARDLLSSRSLERVGIADLDARRAKEATAALKSDRAESLAVDVRDAPRLRRVLADWDVAINATWYELNLDVMLPCIAAGVHYVDLGGLYHMTRKQLQHHSAAKDAGVTCLVGMGSTPGTMNLMAAHAAAKLDRVNRMTLRSGAKIVKGKLEGFFAPYSIRTILDEFTLDTPVLRGGKILFVPALSQDTFELPDPVGPSEGVLTIHSELATIPQNLGKDIKDLDFGVALAPEFAATLKAIVRAGLASREPVRVGGQEVVPYKVTAAAIDALPKPKGTLLDVDVMRVTASGTRDGEPVTVIVDSIGQPNLEWKMDGGTLATGTPPSIGAQWIAQRKIRARGVVPPELAVEPLPYFRELGRNRPFQVIERDEVERTLTKG